MPHVTDDMITGFFMVNYSLGYRSLCRLLILWAGGIPRRAAIQDRKVTVMQGTKDRPLWREVPGNRFEFICRHGTVLVGIYKSKDITIHTSSIIKTSQEVERIVIQDHAKFICLLEFGYRFRCARHGRHKKVFYAT